MRAVTLVCGNKVCAVVFDGHPDQSAFRAADSAVGRAILVVVYGFNGAEFHGSLGGSVESFEDRVGDLRMAFRSEELVLAVGAVLQPKEDDSPFGQPEDFCHLVGDPLDAAQMNLFRYPSQRFGGFNRETSHPTQ